MNIFQTILLGIIQGLTEFLPVSSSGHLVIFQNLLGFKEPELLLDTSLHLGTLLAVCIYFRSDLANMLLGTWEFLFRGRSSDAETKTRKSHAALAWWVLIGTVPTGLIGLFFRHPLENFFGSISLVAVMLLVTGAIVGLTKFLPGRTGKGRPLGYLRSLAIGTAQGLAIIPGISRSGATIACGLSLGLEREMAGRFSFLLSIPAILGAVVLQLKDGDLSSVGLLPLLCGFVSSALVGLLALKVLMGMVRKGHLSYFAPYCWALGLLVLLITR
ncbi:MAG: undecaprenyl-diphosphate phosphatase [Deltaproteobacteria bacterium]|nr:undecaprenyl-diphosphate phosphatase [Deltaproteobacteria bacterium]